MSKLDGKRIWLSLENTAGRVYVRIDGNHYFIGVEEDEWFPDLWQEQPIPEMLGRMLISQVSEAAPCA